jgi:hypothetical protein
MPEYKPKVTVYTPKVSVLLRLTPDDTRFLLDRIRQAIDSKTGVNLVFRDWRGAFSVTWCPEHGDEIKCIGFNQAGFRVESPMRGYKGRWSHCELTYDMNSIEHLRQFIEKAEPHRS